MRPVWIMATLLWGAVPAGAASFHFSAAVGDAWNAKTPLTLRQSGEAELETTARYATRGLKLPWHYTIRAAYGGEQGAWELSFVHHKMYLENTSPDITRFEITHGFNMLTLGYVWNLEPVRVRAGGGLVIANSESVVRGKSHELQNENWGDGYTLTGPVLIGGVEKGFSVMRGVELILDGTLSYGRAKVPIAEGDATATNFAGHFSAGFRVVP